MLTNEVSEPNIFVAITPKLGLRKRFALPMDGSFNASCWCTLVGENLEVVFP